MRQLDRGQGTNRMDAAVPSNQMLRYLSTVEVASDRKIRWGVLTNGRTWRLYFQGTRSRSEDFFELDVAALIGVPGIEVSLFDYEARHGLKLLDLLFRREAFLPQSWDPDARTFHEYALNEARQYEEKVSQDVGDRVFKLVFPALSNALMKNDPDAPRPLTRKYLDEVRAGALILLYRLLFLLYAEDRQLLPIRDSRYRDYSLRKLREDIRDKRDSNGVFSETAARIWETLRSLFNAISNGDSALGLPAYNGGLFDQAAVPLLARVRIPDSQLAPLLDELSRRSEDVFRAWINYRDLSVQHLGSIYERLLEFKLDVVGEEGDERLVALPTSFARKISGSYYTHDDLVQLLLAETLAPLLDERSDAFNTRLDKSWNRKHELKPADWDELDRLDPASRMLDLKVCDPAMGSGHFLVSLVDVLADQILEAVDAAEERVSQQRWAAHLGNADQPAWRSPLVARIADIRERILATAADQGWAVTRAQLDDRHIVRRMILKRVIHGVDKNPMAVELAKVALWLHTFTVGAPLSFLDHHLRCGDALHGENLNKVRIGLQQWGVLFQADQLTRLDIAARSIAAIAELTDIDVAEAHRSKELMDKAEADLAPLRALLDLWRALRWLIPGWPDKRKAANSEWAQGAQALLSGRYNLTGVALASRIEGKIDKRERADVDAANELLATASVLARHEHFLHWPVAFPGVWQDDRGGFDAVIGNPPWDRIKLQQVEWFAERRLEVAQAARAADRKRLIKSLETNGDPLWRDYVEAQDASISAARVFRECGDFPLLSTGDINLYGLFVERAQSLVATRGVVGLLCPSGIAADLGAAKFFRSISTTQRLAALFDFENRKIFFPDVHASFKFCVLVFGGVARTFKTTRCAFYLHRTNELANADRTLN